MLMVSWINASKIEYYLVTHFFEVYLNCIVVLLGKILTRTGQMATTNIVSLNKISMA
jgi:hypothetical protein